MGRTQGQCLLLVLTSLWSSIGHPVGPLSNWHGGSFAMCICKYNCLIHDIYGLRKY